MKRVVHLWILGTLISGCAPVLVSLDPLPHDGQDATFKNGTPVVLSRGAESDVALSPKAGATGRYAFGPRIYVMVAVRNRSAGRVEISEASFTVHAGPAPARIVQAIEVEDSALSDASWAHAMNVFKTTAASMATYDAGTTTFSSSSTSDVRGTTGGSTGTVTTTTAGTSYSAGAVAQARRQVAADGVARAEAIDAQKELLLRAAAAMLQRSTLDPGESIGGVIILEPDRANSCRRIVEVWRDPETKFTGEVPGPCKLVFQAKVGVDTHSITFDEMLWEKGAAPVRPANLPLKVPPARKPVRENVEADR